MLPNTNCLKGNNLLFVWFVYALLKKCYLKCGDLLSNLAIWCQARFPYQMMFVSFHRYMTVDTY